MVLHSGEKKTTAKENFTDLLRKWQKGSRSAYDLLFSIAYGDIEQIAHRKLKAERGPMTLRTNDLVHETFLKMMDGYGKVQWKNRTHFMNGVARAMFQVIIDHMRTKCARPQGRPNVVIDDMENPGKSSPIVHSEESERGRRIDLWRAVNGLGKIKRRWRLISMMRLMGMNHEEIAGTLRLSIPTVKREWKICRDLLEGELQGRLRKRVFNRIETSMKKVREQEAPNLGTVHDG